MNTLKNLTQRNDTDSSLSRNLLKLLQLHQMNESELAKKLDIPYNTIHRLLTGTTCDPRVSTLQQIADYFGVQLDFLLNGNMQTNPIDQKQLLTVPVLTWEHILNSTFLKGMEKSKWEKTIQVASIESSVDLTQLFALESTKSMQPRFPAGTTFIINAKETAIDGDLVLVRFKNDNSVSLRELIVDSPTWQLNPIVSSSSSLVFTHKAHEIIGVVILTIIKTKSYL